MVAATAAGAASMRRTAAKNRKFAASTAPAVRPATPRQAAAEGGGTGHARSCDGELVSDLEQRNEQSAARTDQQPAARVRSEERAPPQETPEREAGGAQEHAPEPDARRRHKPVQTGGERAGRAPRRAGGEGEQITGEPAVARRSGRSRGGHARNDKHPR